MNQTKLADITAIVLAGGKSTRMGGSDKSMLPVKGMPMIKHIISQLMDQFREIIISGDQERHGKLGHRVIPDETKGKGPLMGVYTCLTASSTELNFVTACDMPDINTEFIQNMLGQSDGFDIVMPVSKNNFYEPLHAIYRKTVLPSAAKLLEEGKLKLSDLTSLVRTRFVRIEGSVNIPNINYMEDYEEYEGRKS